MEEAVHGMRGFFIEKSIRAKIHKKPKRRMPAGSAEHVIPAEDCGGHGIYEREREEVVGSSFQLGVVGQQFVVLRRD